MPTIGGWGLPELPEVETTRAGIEPYILDRRVCELIVRQPSLRWPVPGNLAACLLDRPIHTVSRRAKYLLLGNSGGTLLVHLGMSGSLRITDKSLEVGKHDHIDLVFDGSVVLRYTDPRRFGCMLWIDDNAGVHPLLANLGPEPLSEQFDADYLHALSRKRKTPIKSFLMDGRIVVGVGNIYANEALFLAGIHPRRAAGNISRNRYDLLVKVVKEVLANAIAVGGTTLRDFSGSDGKPGYFKQSLAVYGRAGEACKRCSETLLEIRQNQRATVYCRNCQR